MRIVFIIALVLLAGAAVAFKIHLQDQRLKDSQQQATVAGQAERTKAGMIPPGYTLATTSEGVDYGTRWTTPQKCPDGPYCYGLEIVAAEDCPTFLAAQITFAGTIATDVGASRASAKATTAGHAVELLFPVVTPPAGAATLETVTCN